MEVSTLIRVITLVGDPVQEGHIAAVAEADPRFAVVFRCHERAELLGCLRAARPDVVLSAGATDWFDFQCAEEATAAQTTLAGLARDSLDAERLEVAGFTVVSDLDDVAGLLEGDAASALQTDAKGEGRLIAVWGPKGAPGRSTVAVELAQVLSEEDPRTLLVDADLYGGDVAQMLGLSGDLPDIVALAHAGARGELRDPAELHDLPALGGSGPVVLPGLLRAQLHAEVSTFGWTQLLGAARAAFAFTVIDVGFCLEDSPSDDHGVGRNAVALLGLGEADKVVCVARADPIGIRTFLWSWRAHRQLIRDDRTVVVANRVRPGEESDIRGALRKHLAGLPLITLDDHPEEMRQALWRGQPAVRLFPDARLAEQIRRLAETLGVRMTPRGFLSRMGPKRS